MSKPSNSQSRPRAAELSDPLYYLRNFQTLINWVVNHHGDLLLDRERQEIEVLLGLAEPSQALLVRMLMRRGDLFRLSQLDYAEIGLVQDAIVPLTEQGWVELNPPINTETLCALLTRNELLDHLSGIPTSFKRSTSKRALTEQLQTHCSDQTFCLSEWTQGLDDNLVRVMRGDLLERLQLMFFGTLNQDLSAFVLTELGHQRFEAVPFSPTSRAFGQRDEVDNYLQLSRVREALEAERPFEEIRELLPSAPLANAWLERRRSRLMFELARRAERAGDYNYALARYTESGHPQARQRRFRVLELSRPTPETYDALCETIAHSESAAEREALTRIKRRLARQLGLPSCIRPKPPEVPRIELTLPGPAPVEQAVAAHLGDDKAPVYYVENTLINGLFALLCWPALYAPLPGAFFHPFQAAPADLGNPDFVSRRQALFDAALGALQHPGYKSEIRNRVREKAGIACPFIHWQILSEALVNHALECIPASHLEQMFRRLLTDIPAHRSGLPDLIQFYPDEMRYRLIEVKGPGDRLQDHQRRWLNFCLQHEIPVSVCHVRWSTADRLEG